MARGIVFVDIGSGIIFRLSLLGLTGAFSSPFPGIADFFNYYYYIRLYVLLKTKVSKNADLAE
jgi:hypothetical protein